MIFLILLLGLLAAPAWAQQTYSRLTIIPQGDGSAGLLGLRETGGGADIFGLQVGGAMAASYTIRVPTIKPDIGDTLVVTSEPSTNVFQTSWDPGSGGGACGGSFACLGAENVFTNSPQTIAAVGEHSRLIFESDLTSAAAVFSAFMWSGGSAPIGFDMAGLSARGTKLSPSVLQDQDMFFRLSGAGWDGSEFGNSVEIRGRALGTFSGSNHGGYLQFNTAGSGSTTVAERMTIGLHAPGALGLSNDQGIWWRDASSNGVRQLWLDGSNQFHVGPSNQTVSSGGDLNFWATGNVASAQIAVQLEWTGSNAGNLHPLSGDLVSIGTSALPFRNGFFQNTVQIDVGSVAAALAIEDQSNLGVYTFIKRAGAGSNHDLILPNANAAGFWFNNGSGTTSWIASSPSGAPVGVNRTIATSSPLGGGGALDSDRTLTCTTCITTTGTQEMTGQKTLSSTNTFIRNVLPISANTHDLGSSTLTFRDAHIARNGYFGAAIFADGGIDTGTTTNSTLRIGSGNFYQRMVGGSSTGVSCSGVTDGWTGYSTDDYIVLCRGGTHYRVAVASF